MADPDPSVIPTAPAAAPSSPPSMPVSRSYPKYTAEQVCQAIRETKGLVSMTARRLGCIPETVRNYAKRYPTVAQALREEREAMVDVGELALYKKVQEGEGWAVCFLLKTQGKERGYVERSEWTGRDGEPMQVEVVDARARLLAEVEQRRARVQALPTPILIDAEEQSA